MPSHAWVQCISREPRNDHRKWWLSYKNNYFSNCNVSQNDTCKMQFIINTKQM